jgi:putative aminopeptidase FrvX
MTALAIKKENTTAPPKIPVLTTAQLSIRVERLVSRDHMTYLESIIHICDETGIDAEDMAKIVTGSLREKLEAEAQRNNILPRTNTLFND